MKLQGENRRSSVGSVAKYTTIGLLLSTLLVGGLLTLGGTGGRKNGQTTGKEGTPVQSGSGQQGEESQELTASETDNANQVYQADGKIKDIEKLYQENKLTASDLDFWDMYPEKGPDFVTQEEIDAEEEQKKNEELSQREKYEQKEQEELEEEAQKDPAGDGKHTLLTYADGTEEWVITSPYLEKNTYDFTKLTMKADQMAYMEGGKEVSYLGVDLSKYNGDIDFKRIKESGIDFVMLRVGARGYGSGQIMADEKYVANIAAATEAGIPIGLYFFSQAVTKEEAVEEANYVISSIGDYKITYPVVFDMEYVANDKSRIEGLSVQDKTSVAKAFMDTIQKAGHKPMIYGTKEWLIKEVDLTKLTEYDVWLSQQKDMPDYPYQFQMWQYSLEGKVSGVSGNVDLNISFVDYAEK